MRVGILDLLVPSVAHTAVEALHNRLFKRQLASITPQAIAAWCRQLGHEAHYATYYGQSDPGDLLPRDAQVVFIAAFTQASALAYALAKRFRQAGALTVIGGPHARAFPLDCLRFFDLVVQDCDKDLIDDILRGSFDPPLIVSSGRALREIPSVAERLPDIRTASFPRGRPTLLSNVPMLSSVGCPYRCDFCVDWNNPFALLPMDQLARDLHFVARRLPGTLVAWHDPNFAVKFDSVMEVMETVPPGARSPYLMGSSLTILRGARLRRLAETNCVYAAPGIESWADYSNKAGVGSRVGLEKLGNVAAHFEALHQYVPGLGACFIFGTDADAGSEPIDLTIEFLRRVPFVWPQMNIPMPYGGTPMFDQLLAEGRILTAMPFSFYYTPFLVIRLRNYTALEYYDEMLRFYSAVTSAPMTARRVWSTRRPGLKGVQLLRTLSMRDSRSQLLRIRSRIARDRALSDFHDGRPAPLPAFYRAVSRRRLGPYAELLSDADLTPELTQVPPAVPVARLSGRARHDVRLTPEAG
ncbi:MAG TPA: hypothetical protein VNL18_02620 [Gemmatimonadales bacterium]|nr:hypothetical protein [Gemmatimonadales bacterium]